MTRGLIAVLAACLAAAAAPALRDRGVRAGGEDFPGWPASHEGRPLTPVPLAPRDAVFARGFPGRVARFHDGGRQIVLRWTSGPTRRLHPAVHCFRGAGYDVQPAPMTRTAAGRAATCFRATRDGRVLRVCEHLTDGRGRSWPDVSAWWWSAALRPAPGGYWSYVTAEPEQDSRTDARRRSPRGRANPGGNWRARNDSNVRPSDS